MTKPLSCNKIPRHKYKKTFETLDNLLSFRNKDKLQPVISGYNWYNKISTADRIITFSHIHGSDNYKRAMLNNLEKIGYNQIKIVQHIREKDAAYLWDPNYRIRDDNGTLFTGLRIRDLRTDQYIDLNQFKEHLTENVYYTKCKGNLIAEDKGWQLDFPFNNSYELGNLVDLFLVKSGIHIYDKEGNRIKETFEQFNQRSPWEDAYRTPVLIIGKVAIDLASQLPDFDIATRMVLIENRHEISFIIHKYIQELHLLPQYQTLLRLGFLEEPCLVNKPFLKDINNIR
ncbi:MAG: hypothetical protein AABX52_01695 [Nanoarchaeota archaeon]|mgnify:CR=1 FL=1